MTSRRLIASALAAMFLLIVAPPSWNQGSSPPANRTESRQPSGRGEITGEQTAPAEAQQPGRVPRVGVTLPASSGPTFEAFRKDLGELGYIEGRNIVIELRFTEGQLDRLPGLAAELVRLKVDVIALVGAVTARAAKKETTTIPIVFTRVVDRIADGVVSNLDRPGGNVTGLTTFDPQQAKKQLELFKEAIPGLVRVAILGDAAVSEALLKANSAAAQALGLEPQILRVKGPAPNLEGAFDAMRKEHATALLVLEEPITVEHRKRIAELAAADRLSTMFARDRADAGGLIAYGTSILEAARRMAAYVDKVQKGAKLGDLPVETVTHPELIVKLKIAREIGIAIPPAVIKRPDRVIE